MKLPSVDFWLNRILLINFQAVDHYNLVYNQPPFQQTFLYPFFYFSLFLKQFLALCVFSDLTAWTVGLKGTFLPGFATFEPDFLTLSSLWFFWAQSSLLHFVNFGHFTHPNLFFLGIHFNLKNPSNFLFQYPVSLTQTPGVLVDW